MRLPCKQMDVRSLSKLMNLKRWVMVVGDGGDGFSENAAEEKKTNGLSEAMIISPII